MEGRALDRHPRQGWAYLVPIFSSVTAQQMADATDAGRAPYVVLGLAAGAAWQLLYRRDLVSRLTLPVVVACVALVVAVLPGGELRLGGSPAEGRALTIHYLCILVGLVLAEQHLRRQDRRAGEVSPGEAPATNPGTGSP